VDHLLEKRKLAPGMMHERKALPPFFIDFANQNYRHYLLASAGVSTVNALKDLNSFSANTGANVTNGGQNLADTDMDSFVSNLRTRSTMEMIQEGMEQSKKDFDNFLEETVQMNWDAQRLKIYEHFGLGRPAENLDASTTAGQSTRGAFGKSSRGRGLGASASTMAFGASGLQKSVLGNSSMRVPVNSKSISSEDASAGPRIHLEDRVNRERQEVYAKQIQDLNDARAVGKCFPFLHQLCAVEDLAGDNNKKSISHSYKALIEVVEEQSQSLRRSDPAIRSWERKFAPAYLDDNSNSPQSIDLRKRIINGAQKCLEKLFWKKLDDLVLKNPKDAALGGIPSQISKVRGFIRVLAKQKSLVVAENFETEMEALQQITVGADTDYCWALIYYLLRCGLVEDAAQYVTDNNRAIRSLDRNFSRYLDAYASNPARILPNDLRQTIQAEYRGKSRVHDAAQTDPYKIACYKIIGRCELSKKSLDRMPGDQEDWIWLQFALAREVNRAEEAAGDAFGLEQLQAIIKDIGQRHFSTGSDNVQGYGIYFFLQILSGMYEPAIKWLYDYDYVAAVHFSIALGYYGLLRVADLSTTNIRQYTRIHCLSLLLTIKLVSFTVREQPRLQFALMVGYYTAEFRSAKPDVATDYLVLLSLNADLPGEAGRQQAQLCLDALRELVLETREFAQLLGDIQSDGQRLPGAIQSRQLLVQKSADATQEKSLEQFIHKLTIQAAQAADEAGRTTDAVLLYHLAEEYDNVLTIVNRALSEALTVELGQQAMRLEPLKPRKAGTPGVQSGNLTLSLTSVDDPVVLAENILQLYLGPNREAAMNKIKTSTREATQVLLRMAQAKKQLLKREFNTCINTIGNMHILPLDARADVSKVRQSAQNFNALVPVVARCIGDLIIWAVWACTKEKERLTKEGWETDIRRDAVKDMNTAIADLNIFAGLVRYKLRQDVFETLAKAAENSA
jgi:nuclear pore complex protein Nup93